MRRIGLFLLTSVLLVLLVGCDGWQVTSSGGSKEAEQSVEENLSKMESTVEEAGDFESAGWSTMEYMNNLVKIGKPAVPKILEVVKDKSKNPGFRVLLLTEVLGDIKDTEIVPQLTEILEDNQEDEAVKDAVIQCLGMIGDERALEPIFDLYYSPEGEKYRDTIFWALGGFEGRKAAEEVVNIYKNSSDASVRASAVHVLGQIGDKYALPFLIDALKNDPSPGVKAWAAISLGSKALESEEGKQALIDALNDPTIKDKTPIIMALGNLGVAEPLIEMLEGIEDYNKNFEIVLEIVKALGRAKNSDGVEPLKSLLNRLQELGIHPEEDKQWLQNEIATSLFNITGDKSYLKEYYKP
ncbi:HEAT repeat domain-containing protein [Candidatus Calescamantes bacterium]|nr:HEAT repeat domain-containing protein [Candidatus Calescamantes bacterium]